MPACDYRSGKSARLWLVKVESANCGNAPFSSSASFAPTWTGLNTTATSYIGNFSKFPDLNVGSTINPVFTAEGNGWQKTVEGAGSGNANFSVILDSSRPLGDPAGQNIKSGSLYDFVITFGFTNASDLTANSAAGAIVGRLRIGKIGNPIDLGGGNVEQSIEGLTDGPVYGRMVGQPDNATS